MRLQTRNNIESLFEEVHSFVVIEKDTNIRNFKDIITSTLNSPKWKDFIVGKDVSTDSIEFFQGELRNVLLQMKEAYNSLDHVTEAQKTRIGNQLDNFIKSFKEGSKYQERIVVAVGDNPNLKNFDETYLQYHIGNLNEIICLPHILFLKRPLFILWNLCLQKNHHLQHLLANLS
ncbi:hypothetical protein ACJMK2_018653 [Sinanodonta woodiana]|uniref:Uncharacterized protein n=1 Tax=Sinanodonta woodiana TaxID=1069815 RepID=A0ABD3UE21_SINWO